MVDLLAKDRIQLLGDIIVFVRQPLGAELENKVGISLSIDIHGVEVVGFHNINSHQDTQRFIGGNSLEKSKLWIHSWKQCFSIIYRFLRNQQ